MAATTKTKRSQSSKNGDLLALVRSAELQLYKVYDVRLKLVSPLHGGIPQASSVVDSWVAARVKQGLLGAEEAERIKTEYKEENPDLETAKETEEQKRLCSFRSDKKGIYVEGRQVKAMMKEAAKTIGKTSDKEHRGSKQTMQTGVLVTTDDAEDFHGSDRLRFWRDGALVTEPEGMHEAPVHAMTPQGPRTSIKLNDYVDAGAEIRFKIWVLSCHGVGKRAITNTYLAEVLANSQMGGLGANRSQTKGRFEVTALSVQDC